MCSHLVSFLSFILMHFLSILVLPFSAYGCAHSHWRLPYVQHCYYPYQLLVMKCCCYIRLATMSNGWIVHWSMVIFHIYFVFLALTQSIWSFFKHLFRSLFHSCRSFFLFFYLGLWNHVFLFSNLSLFVLLPFSYLFAESSGFFGHRKGIISRAYETFTVFSLLAVVVLGITYVVSAVIYPEKRGLQTLLSKRSTRCEVVSISTNSKCFQIWAPTIYRSCTRVFPFWEFFYCWVSNVQCFDAKFVDANL